MRGGETLVRDRIYFSAQLQKASNGSCHDKEDLMYRNATTIYSQLLASGVTSAGALGLMGNWMAESGLEPNRVQGDFNTGRTLSRAYTDDVMAGRISRSQFARDAKGYGRAVDLLHAKGRSL